ncbi:hypothetical protein Tco_1497484, partial [Tanacetum coccineum]
MAKPIDSRPCKAQTRVGIGPELNDPSADPLVDDPSADPLVDDPSADPLVDYPSADPLVDDPSADPPIRRSGRRTSASVQHDCRGPLPDKGPTPATTK